MSDYIIRPATKADLPALRIAEQAVIAWERPFDPGLAKDPISYYDLDHMFDREDVLLLMAEIGGQLAATGYILRRANKPYETNSHHGYIGFMYTVPAHRGKGIATAIIARLRGWAVEKGLKEIRLEVYDGNASAVRAYEKAGLKKVLVEMRMDC
ncbi:GNAT family N-acetyltransferase [Chitinophaga rhizosphaerae]|uniref:GNAT family N-acetyltransferase n=1 Tax=Chitinophaga rhizosphaerae TaxID=1864947 RepID=UPI000F7FC551|nr:GNAT family N-acetyltransferase [Chitinophaga rhizosphaerae]